MQETWVLSLGGEKSPEIGNGKPPQYSCLENSMDRGTWWSTVCKAAESDTTEQLSMHTEIGYFVWALVAACELLVAACEI